MKRYLFLLVFAAAATLLASVTYTLVWLKDVSGCRVPDDPDVFFSACNHPAFADYEHGAYYLGLQDRAVENLKRADVVFLGSSRVQFGYSTRSTRAFFDRKHVSYHLLGFGYVEQMKFAQALVQRHDLAPRVMVINVDPFFQDYASPMGNALIEGDWTMRRGYYLKRFAHAALPVYCRLLTCKPQAQAIYRRTSTGEWIWANVFSVPDSGHPLKEPPRFPLTWKQRVDTLESAVVFARALQVPPECVVLTAAPNDLLNTADLAQGIARALGMSSVLPVIPDVVMLDEHHLNLPTAERWSAAVLGELEPVIDRCVSGDPPRRVHPDKPS